jgi:hypothetical protein
MRVASLYAETRARAYFWYPLVKVATYMYLFVLHCTCSPTSVKSAMIYVTVLALPKLDASYRRLARLPFGLTCWWWRFSQYMLILSRQQRCRCLLGCRWPSSTERMAGVLMWCQILSSRRVWQQPITSVAVSVLTFVKLQLVVIIEHLCLQVRDCRVELSS